MALDRFHPIPDVPLRADSWAEWLYFNGRAGDTRFYLTFMVGPCERAWESATPAFASNSTMPASARRIPSGKR